MFNVAELKRVLNQLPDNAEVRGWWEGITNSIHQVVLMKDGTVLLDVDDSPSTFYIERRRDQVESVYPGRG